LTASTTPLSKFPFFRITSASAPLGGPHSEVTTNPPLSKIRSIFDLVFIFCYPLLKAEAKAKDFFS
jgi:hypothetical protein